MYITTYQINKPKIVQFLKFKFLTIIKLNFNGGQFYRKIYLDSHQLLLLFFNKNKNQLN